MRRLSRSTLREAVAASRARSRSNVSRARQRRYSGSRGASTPAAGGELVLGAQPVPAVQLYALGGELDRSLARQPGQHGLEGLLLGHAGLEGLLSPESGGDLQRLAPVLAEGGEGVDEEVLVGDRVAYLQRGVPGGEHREVVLVEVFDGLDVVGLQLRL